MHSHHCERMEQVEEIGALLDGLVRSAPRTVSLARSAVMEADAPADARAWALQLCTGRETVLVFVRFCPFCGVDLVSLG